ncbi:MAG: ribosome recycling factor [Candidatus Portnoybacteria bacterium]|nr:ribosome recycling factor [Candidatus Portnoybacteria bacterium]
MYQDIIKNAKPNLDKTLEKLKQEISAFRTGQANPAILENVIVDCYNSRMPLKQVAAINIKEARTLIIQPWDKTIIKNIEKAIVGSVPGLSVAIDSDSIRINLPAPSEETRKEMVKSLRQKLEEARISVRLAREEAWKQIQDLAKEGKIREDDKFRGKEELQKVVDEYNEKIEEIGEKKEKEILTV